ncbi:MAG: hypothetical protein WC548_01035 [Candidatus Pacearchaeota archaeon]
MKIKEVAFANQNLMNDYLSLKEGKFEEKQLFEFVNRAIDDLKENPFCGVKVPKNLWPKKYIKENQIANLWKYNLPNAWRLTYTIIGDEVKIVSMILEWMDHKSYEKRFNY